MDIAEMHVNFRQYAQQMGMQNVRAILPQEIDIFLNQSIVDDVNQLIRENIGITNNNRVITDNSHVGQINALRTLYWSKEVVINIGNPADAEHPFTYNVSDRFKGLIKHIHIDESDSVKDDVVFGNNMFIVGLSINYEIPIEDSENVITSWYPVRIIDSAYLANTLNDVILKNTFKSPIACIYKDDTIELYVDKFKAGDTPKINIISGNKTVELIPNILRIDLIKYPNKVKYVSGDSQEESVDCDLPESMHGDIVKHAVDLYRIAVSGPLHASQQAEQAR